MILRRATDADRMVFFWLRNEPVALRASRRPVITQEEHDRWWENTTDYLWVAESESGAIVGTLRLSQEGTVSIIVAKDARGQGRGPLMLTLLDDEARALGYRRMWAEIAPENAMSQRAFLKAGWVPILMERTL